jgi:hypothetical protein
MREEGARAGKDGQKEKRWRAGCALAHLERLLPHQLAKKVHEEDVVVPRVHDVLAEAAAHGSHDGELLRLNEGLQHDTDRHVDVAVVDGVPQVHARMRFRHAHDRFDMSNGDRDPAAALGGAT